MAVRVLNCAKAKMAWSTGFLCSKKFVRAPGCSWAQALWPWIACECAWVVWSTSFLSSQSCSCRKVSKQRWPQLPNKLRKGNSYWGCQRIQNGELWKRKKGQNDKHTWQDTLQDVPSTPLRMSIRNQRLIGTLPNFMNNISVCPWPPLKLSLHDSPSSCSFPFLCYLRLPVSASMRH